MNEGVRSRTQIPQIQVLLSLGLNFQMSYLVILKYALPKTPLLFKVTRFSFYQKPSISKRIWENNTQGGQLAKPNLNQIFNHPVICRLILDDQNPIYIQISSKCCQKCNF